MRDEKGIHIRRDETLGKMVANQQANPDLPTSTFFLSLFIKIYRKEQGRKRKELPEELVIVGKSDQETWMGARAPNKTRELITCNLKFEIKKCLIFSMVFFFFLRKYFLLAFIEDNKNFHRGGANRRTMNKVSLTHPHHMNLI